MAIDWNAAVIGPRPKQVKEINPGGVKQFGGRQCLDCRKAIMGHWILNFSEQEKRGAYWCRRDGTQQSTGIRHT